MSGPSKDTSRLAWRPPVVQINAPRTEVTFGLIAPHAVRQGLAGTIISEILCTGLTVAAAQLLTMTRAQLETSLLMHEMANSLLDPVIALAIAGPQALRVWRDLAGEFDEPGTLRNLYGSADTGEDVVYVPINAFRAETLLSLFFPPRITLHGET